MGGHFILDKYNCPGGSPSIYQVSREDLSGSMNKRWGGMSAGINGWGKELGLKLV